MTKEKTTEKKQLTVSECLKSYKAENPNECLKPILETFNYSNLTGEEFERYNEFIQQLCPDNGFADGSFKKFDFTQIWVKPVRKIRYPGLKGSPVDFIGIEPKKGADGLTAKPHIHKTRMELRHAKDLNKQVENTERFLLLIK